MWSQQRRKKWSDLRDTCFGRCANQELDKRRRVVAEYQQQVDDDSMSKREAQKAMDDYDYRYLTWFGYTECEHACITKFGVNWIPVWSRLGLTREDSGEYPDPRKQVGELMGDSQDIYSGPMQTEYERIRTDMVKIYDPPGFWDGAGDTYWFH